MLSVGKALGSSILPTIQRWTREMYWHAGTLMGTFSLLSQVYVWLLSRVSEQVSHSLRETLPASRHDRTVRGVAERATSMGISFLDALEYASYHTVLLHRYRRSA